MICVLYFYAMQMPIIRAPLYLTNQMVCMNGCIKLDFVLGDMADVLQSKTTELVWLLHS